ncbi:MAG: hypothetical protein ACREHD_32160, partial [Pirellulales bacterium]
VAVPAAADVMIGITVVATAAAVFPAAALRLQPAAAVLVVLRLALPKLAPRRELPAGPGAIGQPSYLRVRDRCAFGASF